MENNKLENYLLRLDKCLGSVSISEKAEIITEIKSHVMDAIENNKNKSVGHILASLGEPEQVASKYLLEKGLEPVESPKHPIVKWIIIGFLGTFTLMIFTFLVLAWKFSPIVKIDEKKGRIQLFGGVIDFSEDNIKDLYGILGEEPLSDSSINEVKINFSNGKILIKRNDKNKFQYKCKGQGYRSPHKENDSLIFDLHSVKESDCDIKIPSGFRLAVNGKNGKIQLIGLKNHLSANLANGKIGFAPEPNSHYKYQISIKNGKSDEFSSSSSKEAFEVQLSLKNGKIHHLDENIPKDQ